MRSFTFIWLLLCLSLVVDGLTLRLQSQSNEETTRTYTIDETVLPKEVLEIVEVRHLNAENFPLALELEVKNISDKPIYGICVAGIFKGSGTMMALYFGRPALAFPVETPRAEDKPILPSEKGILRVESGIGKGTQAALDNGTLPVNQTLRLEFVFQLLSFGDGTGYQLTHKTGNKKS